MATSSCAAPAGRLELIKKIALRDKKLARLGKSFEVDDSRYTNPTEDINQWKHDVADAFQAMMKTPTALNPLAN